MRLENHNERKIVNSNKNEKMGYKILANAKAFRILSDNLYSDKIGAVIRELSTNAYDSHVEAGKKDIPFEIKLPTNLDPTFWVRDFGIGLSPNKVNSLYRTYFDSTKTGTNDAVGCMGLGSKSPFAYVPTFSVETIWEGVRYSYSSYKDEDGTPTVQLLGTAPTDEPKGIKVSFNVANSDIRLFHSKAIDILQWFETIPDILGAGNIKGNIKTAQDSRYRFQTPEWRMRHFNYSKDSPRAIMGNVCYPVSLGEVFPQKNESKYIEFFSRCCVDLFFNIGDLDIAPSREALSYDQLTIKAIRKKLEGVARYIKAYIEKEIKSEQSLWDARAKASQLLGPHSKFNSIRLLASNISLNWQGQDFKIRNWTDLEYHKIFNRLKSIKVFQKNERSKVEKRTIENAHSSMSYIPFLDKKKIKFIFNDNEKKAWEAKSREFLLADADAEIVVTIHTWRSDAWAGIEWAEFLGLSDEMILLAEDLWKKDPSPKKKKSSTPRIKNKIHVFDRKPLSNNKTDHWKTQQIDLKTWTGWWIPKNHADVRFGGRWNSPNSFKDVLNWFSDFVVEENLEDINLPILGVPEGKQKMLSPQAKNIATYLEEKAKELDEYTTSNSQQYGLANIESFIQRINRIFKIDIVESNSDFAGVYSEVELEGKRMSLADSASKIKRAFLMSPAIKTRCNVDQILLKYESLQQKYPLLFVLAGNISHYSVDEPLNSKSIEQVKKLYNL